MTPTKPEAPEHDRDLFKASIAILAAIAGQVAVTIWWAGRSDAKLEFVIAAVDELKRADQSRGELVAEVKVLSTRVSQLEQRLK